MQLKNVLLLVALVLAGSASVMKMTEHNRKAHRAHTTLTAADRLLPAAAGMEVSVVVLHVSAEPVDAD